MTTRDRTLDQQPDLWASLRCGHSIEQDGQWYSSVWRMDVDAALAAERAASVTRESHKDGRIAELRDLLERERECQSAMDGSARSWCARAEAAESREAALQQEIDRVLSERATLITCLEGWETGLTRW